MKRVKLECKKRIDFVKVVRKKIMNVTIFFFSAVAEEVYFGFLSCRNCLIPFLTQTLGVRTIHVSPVLWKEVTPSVPIEQGVVTRSGGTVVKTIKSSPFSFDRGNAANLIPKMFPGVHCTELGGDVGSTKEEDVRRALCYDHRHKQLRVDGCGK